jgi:serine/threonine protein kinase
VDSSAKQPPDRPSTGQRRDPRIGTVVAGKYAVVRLIGDGGMGSVYEARHETLSRRFAIKFMRPEYAARPDIQHRFENEAKLAGSLEHPNLAAVTDFGRSSDGAPYLVMEYLEGRDCGHLLRESGPLPVARAADLIYQACRGLAVVHRAGAVHRDLKPENLFVTDAGDGSDLVKVLDFGIAKILSRDGISMTGTGILGTTHYMSPEQVRSSRDVDARTDVWSLGVVLYQLLTNRRAFEGGNLPAVLLQIMDADPPSLSQLRPDLPAELVGIVEQTMKKSLEARISSVQLLAQLLAPFTARGHRMLLDSDPEMRPITQPPSSPGVTHTLRPHAGLPPARRRSEAAFWWEALLSVAMAVVIVAMARLPIRPVPVAASPRPFSTVPAAGPAQTPSMPPPAQATPDRPPPPADPGSKKATAGQARGKETASKKAVRTKAVRTKALDKTRKPRSRPRPAGVTGAAAGRPPGLAPAPPRLRVASRSL